MACQIKEITLNPELRERHIAHLLKIEGLEEIKEDINACYCAVPLTVVNEKERETITKEHDIIKQCIQSAGIKIFDPKDALGNPWSGIKHRPEEIYDVDTIEVVTPRFFEFTNVAASTGAGIEQQKAIMYNKIAVIIVKSGVFTSRMSTGARRTILIEYKNIDESREDIKSVFQTLKQFNPGAGICSIHGNTLLGFRNSEVVCLKGLIKEQFPQLTYNFDKYIK